MYSLFYVPQRTGTRYGTDTGTTIILVLVLIVININSH